ncbi:hypothetical protein KIH39_03770 [Telmatocola sphagniphila]|jgi:hypothetical protein|uniref:Tetratricopeptide repeat protein n=1 Tax=Telmatocola sphagniphila TaxID=1123043 RepID=A0A8E6B7A0_9BACT|nr:hypothetical protein [Telmatocola sphagniphila]QVL33046.1 hypothetical protein KIH39_03770 [Telmatocola sphagniphila]
MTTLPNIEELMNRVLDSFVCDTEFDANFGLVEPYDSSAGVKVDPVTAWNEVQTLAKLYGQNKAAAALSNEWSSYAFLDSMIVALPCAIGNYPQQVSDIPRLLKTVQIKSTPKVADCVLNNLNQEKLNKKTGEEILLAVGVARLAGAFDLAQELLNRCQGLETWVRGNEAASTLWMRGEHAEALRVWKIQPSNPVICLNRGMAKIFLGERESARKDLQEAVAGLPAQSGWKHLAQLYLSLCEM